MVPAFGNRVLEIHVSPMEMKWNPIETRKSCPVDIGTTDVCGTWIPQCENHMKTRFPRFGAHVLEMLVFSLGMTWDPVGIAEFRPAHTGTL